MILNNKNYLLLYLLLMGFLGIAQQDAQYTQYMYNTAVVNPAYVGSREAFSATALYRSQWVGLDGAPETQTLNFHTPVSQGFGMGLSVVNDRIGNGTNQETYIDLMFAYHRPISVNANLAFGIMAGGHLLDVNFNQLRIYNPATSLAGQNNIENKFAPNFGAGVYYYTNTFYVGASIPNFLETDHFDEGAVTGLASERMNAYLIAGIVANLGLDWKVKPAVLLKAVNGAPLQTDISTTFLFAEKFSFGGAYRVNAAWSGLMGYQVSRSMMIGLAYDREISELGNRAFNDGSFEVFIRFEPSRLINELKSPRFF